MRMWSDETGEPVTDPAELNRRTVDRCDGCSERREGILYHAAGATGRVCPVLFLCDECNSSESEVPAT